MSFLSFSWLWRLNAPHVQSVSGETHSGCLMATTAAARSPPAAPAQRTARMRWRPPSLPVCPSSRTMAKSTPTPTARLEWVSACEICLELMQCMHLWNIILWVTKSNLPTCCNLVILTDYLSLFHSHLWDVWDGGSTRCLLLQNQALLQCVLFQELFLKFQKS